MMNIDAVTRNRVKNVVFSSTEPPSTNVLWAKSTGDKVEMYVFKNGYWNNIKDSEIDPAVKDYVDSQYEDMMKKVNKHTSDMVDDVNRKLTENINEVKNDISSTDTKIDECKKELDAKVSDESSRAKDIEKSLQNNISDNTNAINTIKDSKQDTLISGTNIKTINNESILGKGNINTDTAPKMWADVLSLIDTSIRVDGKKLDLPAGKNVVIKDFSSVEPYVDNENDIQAKTDGIVRFNIHYNCSSDLVPVNRFYLSLSAWSKKEGKWIYTDPVLRQLDVSRFDTSKMTTMSGMFNNQSNLTYVDVASFDTSNVTALDSMFSGCENITTVPVRDWDTSKVTNMGATFNNMYNLTTLDVSKWDFSKVTNTWRMFCNDSKLQALDVSNWDVSSLHNGLIFYNCSALTKLDVSKWNPKNATSIEGMFYGCSNITSLDLSNFDLSKCTDIARLFGPDTLLSDIKFGEGFGKCPANVLMDLSNCASRSNYNFTASTYESMLTMYDRAANNMDRTFTIKFHSKHNIPDGWIEKMTARGYTITKG